MRVIYRYFLSAFVLLLAGCGDTAAPTGRWEGIVDSPSWIIVVRLQVTEGNAIRASALSANVEGMTLPAKFDVAKQLKSAMRDQWPNAEHGKVDFHGDTMTRVGGVAPLFVFDQKSRAMTFYFYAGGKLTEKVLCLPVE